MQPDTEVCRRPIDQEVWAISHGKLVEAHTTRSTPSKLRKRRRRHQARAPPDNPAIKRLNPSRDVRARYRVSLRTLRRWVLSGVFPPPDKVINGRNYWWEETLVAHERRLVVERPATETSPTA